MKTTTFFIFSSMTLIAFSSQASEISLCKSAQDRDCFTGSFGLVSIPGNPKQKLLQADFGYIDASGIGWQTNKGTETDGASIPSLLQPFVGSPWEDGYVRAAVIHDWYCDHHVRSWKATHKVFYGAMIASGLEPRKAKLMFYAVYAFGPRWGYLIPGTPCKSTDNCIQTNSSVFIQVPSKLDDASNTAELKAVETMIEITEAKNGLSLEDLMTVADRAHPKQDLLDSSPSNDATQ